MEMRPATLEEFDDFDRAVMAAFHREVTEEERRAFRRTDEPERSLAWFDDGRIVAGTSIYSRHVTMPGAVVPCAAVTAVGVVPTHRRRGLLTAMMRRQLEEIHARGEPVAALWASEGAIYGRYGYGIAARVGGLTARRPMARLATPPPVGDPLRAGPAADHVEHMRALYERIRGARPGMLDRPGPWWDARLHDPESRRKGAQPLQALVVPDGYALYAVRADRDEQGPAGEVTIRELVAATPAARALLWEFLLDQDLTRTITWPLAPPDEPLWLMLTDPDAVRVALGASLWLRLVDVPAALSARTYDDRPRRRARRLRRLLPLERRALPAGRRPLRAHRRRARPRARRDGAGRGVPRRDAAERAGGGGPRRRAAPGRAGPRVGGPARRRRAVVSGDLLRAAVSAFR